MFDRFFDFYQSIPSILKSLANFGYWMANTEVEFGNFVFTPIEIVFGAGLTIYAGYTIIKYALSIVS